ncbi:hypothetical protein HOY82DRAFT_597342 [Tuber indicum]|nr:hypothetical protein HOY82DRAFT_597342 [Tuber indicum]
MAERTLEIEIKPSTSDLPPNIVTHVARHPSQVAPDIFSQMLNSSSRLVSSFPVPEIALHQLLDATKWLPENNDARALSYLLQNNLLSTETPAYCSIMDHTWERNLFEERCASILEPLTTTNPNFPLGTLISWGASRPTGTSESSEFNGGPETSDISLQRLSTCGEPCASRIESPLVVMMESMGPELEYLQLVNKKSEVPMADHATINDSNSLIPNNVARMGGTIDALARLSDERMTRAGSKKPYLAGILAMRAVGLWMCTAEGP